MELNKSTESTNENNYIPNIYNFCDRWCQKCGFTNICEASADAKNTKTEDEKNRLFWKEIEARLPEIQNFVINMAAKKQLSLIDFDAPTQKKNFDLFQRDAKSNVILKAGRMYEDAVDDWFDDALDNNLVEIIETPNGSAHRLATNIKTDNPDYINSLFDVVLRYQLQVYLKLSRTFYSRGVEAETDNNEQLDSLGSAKAVLSLFDRSLAAWGIISQNNLFNKDSIFELMLQLTRLKNNINTEFPDAQNFVRPGLDE